MEGGTDPSRVTKHANGWAALHGLDAAIDGLESLRHKIKDDDSPKTAEKLPDAPAPPLSEFLTRLGEEIESKSVRINELIQTIREALF